MDGRLVELDGFSELKVDDCPACIHTSHRWTLAIIYFAQTLGYVDKPCTLIYFDSHADHLDPRDLEQIKKLVRSDYDGDDILDLCENFLSSNNDDWVFAAMRLGLVSDALGFGFHDHPRQGEIAHSLGEGYRFWTCEMPGSALSAHGVLGDHFRRDEECAQPLWDILGWGNHCGGRGFKEVKSKVFVSIDLDCFRLQWREFTLPWPDRVYESEFARTHGRTGEWSGGDFCDAIIDRAGFLDVVREPLCCGGIENARKIFSDMNRHMFLGRLGGNPV